MNYLLVTHFGNAGSLLMLEPTLEALFYKHAPCQIMLLTREETLPVLKDHPLIWGHFGSKLGLEGAEIPEGAPVITYDFREMPDTQETHTSEVDRFAQFANVTLLRRTPSFGSYAHVEKHPRAQVTVNLDLEAFDNRVLALLKERSVRYFSSDLSSDTTFEDTLTEIKGSDILIGSIRGIGMHVAHAGGVRNIIVYDDETSPHAKLPYPNVTYVKRSDGPESLLRAVEIALTSPKYPDCLNRGNACEWIKNKAMEFCKGHGLDVGSNQDQWALPGAIASDEKTQKFHLGPFDYIFSSHCLEHVREWQDYLKLWEQSVKVGGTVFLYLPHPAMEPWRPEGEWVKGGWHVWSPEPVTLVKWLHENTKLKVQEYSVYPDSAWGFYIVAKKES